MELTITFDAGKAPQAQLIVGPRAAGPTPVTRAAVVQLGEALDALWPPDPTTGAPSASDELRATVARWREDTRAARAALVDQAAQAKAATDAFAEPAP